MAKDAKGHGSEARGGGSWRTAVDSQGHVVSMPPHLNAPDISDHDAARALAQGGNKSAPVPIHSGAAGRMDAARGASEALARGDFPLADAIRRANGLPGGNADQPGWKPAKGTEARYAAAVKMRDPVTANLMKR